MKVTIFNFDDLSDRMGIIFRELSFRTHEREEIIDITYLIRPIVNETVKSGLLNGICRIFIPHTTAGITINENADPDVKYDFINVLNTIIPCNPSYKHFEGNSDAHVKASLMGFLQEILIHDGILVLGTWQGIMFCEFDGPRDRKIIIQLQGDI